MRGDLLCDMAREIMGRPDAHLASLESLSVDHDGIDGVRIELRDAPLLKSGNNAGGPNWRKSTNPQSRIFLRVDVDAWEKAWSERTGKCLDCAGSGETFLRWSSTEGTTMRPCRACDGTGARPAGEPVQDGPQ